MNKAELVSEVKNILGDEVSKALAEKAVNAVVEAIKTGIVSGDGTVQLIGFGTFKVTERKARNGINPKTKKPIEIAASKSVKFLPGKALKDSVK